MDSMQIDRDIYDDEAFIGVREGEIEGKVLDDLDAGGACTVPLRLCAWLDLLFAPRSPP